MVFSSDIRNGFIQYGQTLKSLKLLTGDLNGQTELLAVTVQNLTPKQQALALAIRGVNQAQIAEVLSLNNVEEKQAQQVLFDTAIIQKKKQLTKAYALEAITAQGLSTEKANEIMKSAGIVAANNSEVISKKQVSVATLEAKLAQEGLSATQIKAITTQLGLGTSTLTLSNYFKGLAASTWASVKAIGAFLVTNPVGWCILAAGAIAGVVAAVDLFTVSLKEQQEITQKLQDEYDEITQKLSDVESELKTVTDRIDELNRKEHLSFVEQEELDKLTETNTQLERQNAILKEQQEIKGRELAKSIQVEYKKDFQDKDLLNDNASRNEKIDVNLNKYKELQENIDIIQNQIEDFKQKSNKVPSEYEQILEEFKEKQDNIRKKLINDAVDIQEYINKYNLDDDFAEQLQNDFEKIDRILNPAEYKTIDFDRIIKIDKFKDDIEEINQLTKDGLLDKTVLNKQFPELVEALNEVGMSTDEIVSQFYSLNQVSDTTDFEKPNKSATNFLSTLESTSKKVKLITTAMEEMNDTGSISSSTYGEIVEMGGNFTDCLEIQNGKLILNVERLKELETQEYMNSIAANEAAIAELNYARAREQAYGGDTSKIDEQLAKLREENALWNTIIEEINNAKPDDKKSSSDPYKDEADGKISEIKHQYEMEQISYKDYIDEIEKINQEYFANKTKYLDEYYKYEEEVYKGRKKLAEDYYNNLITDLESQVDITLETSTSDDGTKLNTKEKFDYVRSIYQEILNLIEEQINNLIQEGVDGNSDAIKQLEKQYQEYAKKLENVFEDEINSEIDYIKTLQENYNDMIDGRIDFINKEKEAVEEKYDTEIKKIDETIDALQKKNDEDQLALDLAKAQQELEKSKQRTRKVYGADGSVSYNQDSEVIAEAQQKVNDLNVKKTVNDLENQKEALENEKDTEVEKYDEMITALETQQKNQESYYDALLKILDAYLNPNTTESIDTVWENIFNDKENVKINDGSVEVKGTTVDTTSVTNGKMGTDDVRLGSDEAIINSLKNMGASQATIDKFLKGEMDSALMNLFNNSANSNQFSTQHDSNKWSRSIDDFKIANGKTENVIMNIGDIVVNKPVGNASDLAKELMMNLPNAFQNQMYTNLKK